MAKAGQSQTQQGPETGRGHEISEEAGLSRRSVLGWAAVAGAGAALGELVPGTAQATEQEAAPEPQSTARHAEIAEVSIAELQARMTGGALTSLQLVNAYLDRIDDLDRHGPGLNSVLEINPDARRIARLRDRERRNGFVRGPLHGIPVMLKGNVDTADRMSTTAGSLALLGNAPHQDAVVAARLRQAGAVVLGKTNLSEWANFRGFSSTSGWSGQGGQTRNPYVLDRNPCGSSSGSAAAVAASLCAAGLGTETDGSIVCPANANGVVGIKPTVGLTSRAGVIPISHTQDTVGPHGRTVADAAAVLGAITGVDGRDPATAGSSGHFFHDYTQFLDPNGLAGKRLGVLRGGGVTGYSAFTDGAYEAALAAMADAGAILVDPADIPTLDELNADSAEIIVLIYEFKRDLNAYLASRTGVPIGSLAELIDFNRAHADAELRYFGQEFLELAEDEIFSEAEYLDALARGRQLAATDGIDAVLSELDLDALVAPTGSPAWTTDLVNGDHFLGASSGAAAVAGYPIVNVPMGFAFGLPLGLSFMGRAWSEPALITLASGFEAAMQARRPPTFEPTLPFDAELARRGPGLGARAAGPGPERRLAAATRAQRRPLGF